MLLMLLEIEFKCAARPREAEYPTPPGSPELSDDFIARPGQKPSRQCMRGRLYKVERREDSALGGSGGALRVVEEEEKEAKNGEGGVTHQSSRTEGLTT